VTEDIATSKTEKFFTVLELAMNKYGNVRGYLP
jgi:hypothetical protein